MKTKTQDEVAKKAGIGQSHVSMILRGQRAIGRKTAQRFSAAFGRRPGWWIEASIDDVKRVLKLAA